MTQPSVRAVLFDVEGVIAHTDDAALDAALAEVGPGLDAAALFEARNTGRTYPLWTEYSVGALTPERYWAEIARELGLTPEEAGPALRAAKLAAWWASLDEAVLRIVDELRAARGPAPEAEPRLGVLSNSAPEHDPHIQAFAARFDVLRFSHRVGRRKPDPAAYREAAAELGVPPETVIFIDDKPRNTEAAAALGMIGLVFQGAPALRASLRAHGLALP